MVECNPSLSVVFHSLADDIRRDILARVSKTRLTVSQIAEAYDVSLAAVAKHIAVLEKASLVKKERRGKEQLVSVVPSTLEVASTYLSQYEILWTQRFDVIDAILQEE
jgi:DNA-binding transcriptional ArsR family regulator